MKAPTQRQLEILAFIRDHVTAESRPPTLREICARFGLASTNGAHDHLRALEKQGLLERTGARHARGWRPTRPTMQTLGELGLDHAEVMLAAPVVTADDAINVGDYLRAMARVSPVHVRDAMLRVGAQLSSAGAFAKAGS